MNVTLISHTPDPWQSLYLAYRTCYSALTPQEILAEIKDGKIPHEKVMSFCLARLATGHASPLEQVNFEFAISGVSRAFSHQFVRTRVGMSPEQQCLTGDTVVYLQKILHNGQRSAHQITIAELYQRRGRRANIRCVDSAGNLTRGKVKKVWISGVRPVFTMKTTFGYSITGSADHRYLRPDGSYARLAELKVGDVIMANGINALRDREWLRTLYHEQGLSHASIATLAGCSSHTVRSWVRKHGLQKEMGEWSVGATPWNKGLTKNDDHRVMGVSIKMTGKPSRQGFDERNSNWKGRAVIDPRQRNRKLDQHAPEHCQRCQAVPWEHRHHIDKDIFNNTLENTMWLCAQCHSEIHKKIPIWRIRPVTITSIEPAGEQQTYDIEMETAEHNFIANGLVTHNSQRYVKVKPDEFEYVTPPTIEAKAKNWFDAAMDDALWRYHNLIELGIPAEDARFVLPNAAATNLKITINFAALLHMADLRLCTRAQWEYRKVVAKMRGEIMKVLPDLAKFLQPKCGEHRMGYCDESVKDYEACPLSKVRPHKNALLARASNRSDLTDESFTIIEEA